MPPDKAGCGSAEADDQVNPMPGIEGAQVLDVRCLRAFFT
jgi:hypothetical protein